MSARAKVLFFAHSSVITGGGEGALLETIASLQDNAEVKVVLPSKGDLFDELTRRGIESFIVAIPWWTKGGRATQSSVVKACLKSLDTVIEDFKPTTCITNTSVIPWGAFAARKHGIPHVWFVHEMIDPRSEIQYELPFDQVTRIIGELSEFVVANGPYCKDELAKIIPDEKILTIMPIMHLSKVTALSKESVPAQLEELLAKKHPIITVVGRVLPTKGQEDAVRALGILRRKNITAELLLIGESQQEYVRLLMDSANEYGVRGNVHVIPHTKNPFVYIAHSDVIVNTSRLESFGRSTIEAMILGKAVVGADNSSTATMIKDGNNGLLYKTGDASSLANAIDKLINNNTATKNITKNALETVVSFENETSVSVDKLYAIIRENTSRVDNYPGSIEYLLSNIEVVDDGGRSVDGQAPVDTHARTLLWRVKNKVKRVVR